MRIDIGQILLQAENGGIVKMNEALSSYIYTMMSVVMETYRITRRVNDVAETGTART